MIDRGSNLSASRGTTAQGRDDSRDGPMGVHDMIGLLAHLPALFAARHHEQDPIVALIGFLVFVAIAIAIAIREASTVTTS